MKNWNTHWFSIVLAMGIVLLLSLIWLYLMEYMVPFSRNVRWIENASQAFYLSYAWVEENVYKVYSGSLWSNQLSSPYAWSEWYVYAFTGSSRFIPETWQWNAQNSNYSRFSQSEPISLQIWNGRLTNGGESINFQFTIPNGVWFESPTSDEIILVQLSWEGGSLSSASWALIRESDVNTNMNLLTRNGTTLTGNSRTFRQFFWDLWCANASTDCVLKLSVIRPLVSNSWNASIPYLQYRITSSKAIPYPNPLMTSLGKSFWFSKSLEVFIPQQATSSAFDFTVLQ